MKKDINGYLKIIIAVIIVGLIGFVGVKYYKEKQEQEAVTNMCQNVVKTVPEGITKEKYYSDERYVKDIDCVSLCNLGLNEEEDCYEWSNGYKMTFIMEDSFDQLSDAEQYEIIKRIGQSAFGVYYDELNNQYPEYKEYEKKYKFNDILFGKLLMTVGGKEDVLFKTSTNTYEYAHNVGDYFIKNGEEVFIRDKDGHWNGFGTHYCLNCGKPAYNKIVGFSGETEWYCDDCYNELKGMLDNMINN